MVLLRKCKIPPVAEPVVQLSCLHFPSRGFICVTAYSLNDYLPCCLRRFPVTAGRKVKIPAEEAALRRVTDPTRRRSEQSF